MNKRWMYWIVVLLALSLACNVSVQLPGIGETIRGSGNVISESREVSGFDQISVCCGMQLILTQGETESLEIEADDNLLPEIESYVEGSQLIVRFKDDGGGINFRTTQTIRVRVSAREIRGVEVSGGGQAEVGDVNSDRLSVGLSGGSLAEFSKVIADALTVDMSGGGNFSAQELAVSSLEMGMSGGSDASIGKLSAGSLKVDGSGGGQATIAGSVNDQAIEWSGGGKYRAGDLESQTAVLRMSGGGSATLWVHDALDADLSGGASGEYYGRPVVNQDVSGGGSLKGLGDK